MSSKSSILLTYQNEHFYHDVFDIVEKDGEFVGNGITLEFNKSNVEFFESADFDDITIQILKYSDLWERVNALLWCKSSLHAAVMNLKEFPNKNSTELIEQFENLLNIIDK